MTLLLQDAHIVYGTAVIVNASMKDVLSAHKVLLDFVLLTVEEGVVLTLDATKEHAINTFAQLTVEENAAVLKTVINLQLVDQISARVMAAVAVVQ
mmetsp:Transcript_12157/g.18159  ORF Transcript_12157/g.18159 Transcript_12157/m.18159 type:complete len:96 (+) Transcript_12157:300-587(+)|eukprot:15219140-Ditylum_brightwellii.AAC.2